MRLAVLALLAATTGCPGGDPKYPQPKDRVEDVIARLAAQREARTSFSAESVMDYWFNGNRLKGTVLVMGTVPRQVRFNALSPQGDSTLADMACDGDSFTYVNMQNNCQLTGPCNRSSIANLLQVEMEPDDFLRLALGTPPVLASAKSSMTWDAKRGQHLVTLESPEGTQTIEIDAREGRTDVVKSQLVSRDGKLVWSVENADFTTLTDEAGKQHRLPNKTRFKTPRQEADLLVAWGQRKLNRANDPSKFTVPIPQGLPECGTQAAPAAPAAPAS